MASHISRRATAPDRLLVEVVLIDPVSVGYSVKSDGTPDLRYAVNKSFIWYFVLVEGSSYSSRSSARRSSSCEPLESDGTLDMRFKANRR